MSLYVANLWRYPVKTLAGELLSSVAIGADGVAGDRLVRVRGPEGVRTARRHYRLLGLHGTLSADGTPLVNGYRWDSAEAAGLVKSAGGQDAWLNWPTRQSDSTCCRCWWRPTAPSRRSVATSGGCGRTLSSAACRDLARPNGPAPTLQIGRAIVRLDSLRGRCPMTTVDPTRWSGIPRCCAISAAVSAAASR